MKLAFPQAGIPVALPCGCRLHARQMPPAPPRRRPPFAAQGRLPARVLHPLVPANLSWPVTHLDHGLGRNQVQVQHLVARRAEQDKIAQVVVVALAVQVSNFQHLRYAESAMRAEQPVLVVLEGELAIVDAFHCSAI